MNGWMLAICLTVEALALVGVVYFNRKAVKLWKEAERNWASAEANWRKAEESWNRIAEMNRRGSS